MAQQRPVADIEERYKRHRGHHHYVYAQGWSHQRVIDLFAIIDWILARPKPLEQQVWQDIDDVKRKPNGQGLVPEAPAGVDGQLGESPAV